MVWAKGKKLQGGRYVIEESLGQGGFGVAYKAWHTKLKTYVVIKTLHDHYKADRDYKESVRRFLEEGQALARLSQTSHRHIVKVRELFDEGNVPCLVMDCVEGETFFHLVSRSGPLKESEAIKYIRQIAEALAVCHQAGIIHRDVHPGNIILQDDGNAVLIDFGIARDLESSNQTMLRQAGHRDFAPYEQLLGEKSQKTVDIYALAATLYYIVTGEQPISSRDRKRDKAHLAHPRELNPRITPHLNRLILQGMDLNAKKRPQSMEEFLRLLRKPEMSFRERIQIFLESFVRVLGVSDQLTSPTESDEFHASEQSTGRFQSNAQQSPQYFYTTSNLNQHRVIPLTWLIGPFCGYVLLGCMISYLSDLENSPLKPGNSMISAWITSLGFALSGGLANVREGRNWALYDQAWLRNSARAASVLRFRFLTEARMFLTLIAWLGILFFSVGTAVIIAGRLHLGAVILFLLLLLLIYLDLGGRIFGEGSSFSVRIGQRLQQDSFRELEVVLILAGTSALGLGIGWLVGGLLRLIF